MPASPGRTIACCPGPAASDGRRRSAPARGPRRSGGVARHPPLPSNRPPVRRGPRTAPACRPRRARPLRASPSLTGLPDFAASPPPAPAPAAPMSRSTGCLPPPRLAAVPSRRPRPPAGSSRRPRRRGPAQDRGGPPRRPATGPGAAPSSRDRPTSCCRGDPGAADGRLDRRPLAPAWSAWAIKRWNACRVAGSGMTPSSRSRTEAQ